MHNKILIILFFCLLGMSPIFKIFESSEQENTEKRIKATFPTFELGSILELPEKFTSYINDNFGGRSSFISINSFVKSKIFKTVKSVSFGTNGWLYLSNDIMLSIHVNAIPYTEEDLKRIARIQMERKEWLKLQGMDYYLFIPPVAHTIYSEHLPSRLKKGYPLNKREQIIDYLEAHTDIKVIKPYDYLKEKKVRHELYYKTDTHWNPIGGFYAYQYVIDYLRKAYPGIPPALNESDCYMTIEECTAKDLLDVLKLPMPMNSLDTVFRPKKVYPAFVVDSNRGPKKNSHYIERAFNNADTTLPSILMYRDSYAGYVTRYFPYHFNKIVLLWEDEFRPELTRKERCDIVLFEIAEHLCIFLDKENPTELTEELMKNGIEIKI